MTATRIQGKTEVPLPKMPEPANSENIIPSLREVAVQTIASLQNLSFGGLVDGEKAGHLDGVACVFIAPTPANTEFTVYHSLGRRPKGRIIFGQDQVGVLSDLLHKWTDKKVVFKSTRALQTYRVLLF